jgi:hypothetical protein
VKNRGDQDFSLNKKGKKSDKPSDPRGQDELDRVAAQIALASI